MDITAALKADSENRDLNELSEIACEFDEETSPEDWEALLEAGMSIIDILEDGDVDSIIGWMQLIHCHGANVDIKKYFPKLMLKCRQGQEARIPDLGVVFQDYYSLENFYILLKDLNDDQGVKMIIDFLCSKADSSWGILGFGISKLINAFDLTVDQANRLVVIAKKVLDGKDYKDILRIYEERSDPEARNCYHASEDWTFSHPE